MNVLPRTITRCSLVSVTGYGCWLTAGHHGGCEPDGSKLGAVPGGGPCCRHCGQPLIRWPSQAWADTGGMVVCEVTPGSKRFRAHEPVPPGAITAADRIAVIVADTNDRKIGPASAMRQIEMILRQIARDAAVAERSRIRQLAEGRKRTLTRPAIDNGPAEALEVVLWRDLADLLRGEP